MRNWLRGGEEVPQAQASGDRLGEHGRDGGPRQPPGDHRHQQVVEQHVEHAAPHQDPGGEAGSPVVAQQGGKGHGEHRKHPEPGVPLQIGEACVEDDPLRAHPDKHGLAVTNANEGEQRGGDEHHHQGIANDMARPGLLPLAQIEGGQRRGSHADQGPHRVEHGADGVRQHHAGQPVLAQDMADEDAVYGDIDAGDQHGGHRGGDVTQEEAGKGGRAQIDGGHKLLNEGERPE